MLRKGKKDTKPKSILEEEQMQSPFRTIIQHLCENKVAMGSAIIFIVIFLMCFILPIWMKQDLNFQDPTQKNIAPGFSFLSVPKELKRVRHSALGLTTMGLCTSGELLQTD